MKKNRPQKKKEVEAAVPDFEKVTDRVKIYLPKRGFVTLLSGKGKVERAKKMELGEKEN